ncbi:NRDE family protein [Litoribrevibacter albus]|uniref:NRDE family protein n=1 Tax=Litoribrevibacter albus TaxID=1473156 RepID=A0AA37SDI9_9GAMM|nr:NRDE family protein [Litoribrevibacter albus]GLQ33151.1 hypothetical protein GCM10007876_36300 [Litoribrevibacter albus]
MCLVALAYKVHPEYPLVAVANRDEYHHRQAHPAHWWPDAPSVVAGKDLSAGGSWMASDHHGRLICLTNVRMGRAPQAEQALSRGKIVSDYIVQNIPAEQYLKQLSDRCHLFNPFNLLIYESGKLFYCNSLNRGFLSLPPGLYGLSNAFLDTPWPKVQAVKSHLQHAIIEDQINPDTLTNTLSDRTPYAHELLPDTGIPKEMEHILSSAFIVSPTYGTRCTSVFWQDQKSKCYFRESNWFATGEMASQQEFSWKAKHFQKVPAQHSIQKPYLL